MSDQLTETQLVPYTALVLAGRRSRTDRLTPDAESSHKALTPVAGVPMLVRVVRNLQAVPMRRIVISIDDAALLDNRAALPTDIATSGLSIHKSAASPSRSVLDYWQNMPDKGPLLVTTADHPLLTAEMVRYFCAASERSDADVVVGVVAASVFRVRYPESKRTFIPLRDESFCGANLFAFRRSGAGAAATFWTRAEQFRKRPWRLARTFGVTNLLLFALRRLDLTAAVTRASRVIGARIAVIPMPFPECAIDVDSPGDLVLATRILEGRKGLAC